MASFEVEYEEDLISRIQNLINEYDKDSILKEYLQNADDSGATEIIITYDKRKHTSLKNDAKYEPAHASSLLIYNNAEFKENDFKSIVKISARGKINDANSTGRFGQGFSSSFSISDHPSFISNGRAYWFDVLRQAVSREKSKKSIQGWGEESFSEIELWLNTFKLAGFTNNFKGTIFRLPLRDKHTAEKSEISNEVFTFNDFLKWVNDWKGNSDNLLFLRHLHKLVLQEITENGDKIIHLEIETDNINEIENIKQEIQNHLNGNPLEICNKWKKENTKLPIFSYKHKLKINFFDKEEYQSEKRIWAVVNGLFRGQDNNLIQKAHDVLQISNNPRKVLPWVGVAIEIDSKNKPLKFKSKFFTTLPLPIKSYYPIHIHGWFDLNDTRTQITNQGSSSDKKTLIKWNQELLKDGVGVAWALLIDYVKSEQNSYYSLWAKDTEFELNDTLVEGFYQKISTLNCFYVYHKKDKPRWISPKEDLYYFKDEKNQVLFDAFKEHFTIIFPKPPKFIIENFENIDIELIEITNEYIRNYLTEESNTIEFPISFDEVSISMLSKKEWLLEVIKYCADNGEDYSLLDKLPLELTLNNDIYKIDADTLFDKNPNLKLFQNMNQLYIDVDIINSIENTDNLPSSWLEPTLKNQIGLLSKKSNWEKLDISKEWLEEIVNVIISSTKEEFDEAKDIIKELQVVYQENDEYGKIENDIDKYPPFMPRDEDIENNLIYLDEIFMNIVHHEYVEIYKPLLKYNGLITELTSKTLIQHLLLLDSFKFFKKKESREYLLDILTEDISWFEDLSNNEKLILESIPFIKTVTDNIYRKDTDTKLFLPTDFTPPEHIQSLKGEYELIAVDTKSKLFELYKKMGIEEQTAESYIKEIIIPFLENSNSIEEKRDVLKWLAMEFENITKSSNNDLVNLLRKSSIIPIQINEKISKPASTLYHPEIEFPPILQNKEFMPISFKDDIIEKKWINFLEQIGISFYILSSHIISRVKQIVEENNQDDSIELLNYISNHFEIFERMDILDTLKEYAWFPAEKPNDILKPKDSYTELKKVNNLILFDDLKIGGGYYHILDRNVKLGKKDEKGEYAKRDMADKLGIVINIPNESFFESFRELMKLSPSNGQVINYARDIYKYIGRRFKGESIDFDIEERTILINNQWVAPKYVYQHKINLTGIYSWSSLVGNETESNLAKGLVSLGVQEKPTFDFFIEQLQKLPQEQDLNSNQLNDAKALLHEIQNKIDNLKYHELAILTPYNQLVLSSHLYINDFPAYKKAEDKNKKLKFCQGQFDRLARRLDVLALSENYTSKISDYEECESSHKIVNIMKNDSFKEGILRLLFHEKVINEDEINESILHGVLPLNLIFVKKLIIEYSIENNFLFSSNETTYEENGELYIFEQDDEDDMIEVIAKYICDTKNLSRDSFGWIERILRNQMSREDIHDFLDKKKVIELPQQFDIEDEASIFDDSYPMESNKEVNYDDSTNQEENSESKGEIAPPTKPKKSSENVNNDDTSNSSNNIEGGNKSSFDSSSNKSNKKTVSSNDRRRVHVYNGEGSRKQNDNIESPKEKGDRGEDYIIKNQKKFIQSKSNYFEKAPLNNKGFDIFEKNSDGEIIRYIEVKSKDLMWGENGVSISKYQFEFAKEEQDKWWLFVVENTITDNPKVYIFQNPVITISNFMLDSSWKQLAYHPEKIENQEPKVDDKYEIKIEEEMRICVVTNVKPKGVFFQVDLILENGKEIKKKKFKKSWRKL